MNMQTVPARATGSTVSAPHCLKLNVNASNRTPATGLVVSDLHLFARRSIGRDLMRDLLPDLRSQRLLVLNGDVVDFRWSTCANHAETIRRTMDWLGDLIHAVSRCEVHYVLGNHDCHAGIKPALSRLASAHPRFHWHEFHLQLGGALFLHGDCTNWRMNRRDLQAYRESWGRARRQGRAATGAYRMLDRIGLTRMVNRLHFPIDRTLDRLAHHLDEAHAGWRQSVRHCYFGHTHEPFANQERDGVTFHNTGSAIQGLKFNPLTIDASSNPAMVGPAGSIR